MSKTEFVYTTYIQTTPEKVWAAITNPEFSRQYWVEGLQSDWTAGSPWRQVSDSSISIHGVVLESVPPKRLVISWSGDGDAGASPENSRVTFDIEPLGKMVRLQVSHAELVVGSTQAGRIANGWPRVLCSMKSLLETGQALDTWAGMNQTEGCASGAAKIKG